MKMTNPERSHSPNRRVKRYNGGKEEVNMQNGGKTVLHDCLEEADAPRLEAAEIEEKLNSLFEQGEGQRWLCTPQDCLGGVRPIDLIGQNQGDRVLSLLLRLEQGIHA
jgi:hypothetical protein